MRLVSSKRDLAEQLLAFPDAHPYAQWTGTPLALGGDCRRRSTGSQERLDRGVSAELAWLLPGLEPRRVPRLQGRARCHASMEGNALLDWQWPDGGWNCDRHPDASRSSFHESVIPALGLATYAHLTGDADARAAAERTAENSCWGTGCSDLDRPASGSTRPGWCCTIPPTGTTTSCRDFGCWSQWTGSPTLSAADALEVLERARRPRRSVLGPPMVLEPPASRRQLGGRDQEPAPERASDRRTHRYRREKRSGVVSRPAAGCRLRLLVTGRRGLAVSGRSLLRGRASRASCRVWSAPLKGHPRAGGQRHLHGSSALRRHRADAQVTLRRLGTDGPGGRPSSRIAAARRTATRRTGS